MTGRVQGVVQGIVTGVRGLCSGLGPAMFGLIFYLFHVDLSEPQGGDVQSVVAQSPNATLKPPVCEVKNLVLYFVAWK